MNEISSELLPCPFCGNQPRLTQSGGHDERDGYTVIHSVRCFKCGTEKSSPEKPFGGPSADMAKKAAVRFWNSRVDPTRYSSADELRDLKQSILQAETISDFVAVRKTVVAIEALVVES